MILPPSYNPKSRGVTLVELLVAVVIMIMVLLMTSMIFKSSTEASGRATAHADIMRQLRALTEQIDKDFAHLRPDMPMAVCFEGDWEDYDNDGFNDGFIRHDRIVFFTHGDFQDVYGIRGNLARIFYGQSSDTLNTPETETISPERRILARRTKILTPDSTLGLVSHPASTGWGASPAYTAISASNYDEITYENATESEWKQDVFQSYVDHHLRVNTAALPDNPAARRSIMRRPNISLASNDLTQSMYFLPDTTNFQIDVWFGGTSAAFAGINNYWVNRWLPDIIDIDSGVFMINAGSTDLGFYFNAPGPVAPSYTPNTPFQLDGYIDWYSVDALSNTTYTGLSNPWPRALRFTFTLYDQNRRYYPEGLTFSYLVKLPQP